MVETARAALREAGSAANRRISSTRFCATYWLDHCEGFRVDIDGQYAGYVEHVERSGAFGLPEAIHVRLPSGAFARVPIDAVVDVVPESERLVLSGRHAADLDADLFDKVRSAARAPRASD